MRMGCGDEGSRGVAFQGLQHASGTLEFQHAKSYGSGVASGDGGACSVEFGR
jgi:hypothetical protein